MGVLLTKRPQRGHLQVVNSMILARIEGNLVSTVKHPSLNAWRLLICQPVSLDGKSTGVPVIAIDSYGASLHQKVIISTDGGAARLAVGDPKSPVRNMIVGIVDETSNRISQD